MSKKKYSAEEKKAYWLGVGAAIGLSGDTRSFRENLKTERMQESFNKGFGREASLNPPSARFDKRGNKFLQFSQKR